MKKPASPTPTSRAAALSQSASRFSAGATSSWQSIAGKSPRLAATGRPAPGAARNFAPLAQPTAPGANRVALEPQRVAEPVAPAAAPETIRQVGWREVDRAVGMSTKRKYSVFGIGFGPKVPVFETEKVKLPVYQETDREKRYYAIVKAEDAERIKREGFQTASGNRADKVIPQTVEQFNVQKGFTFFSKESDALRYGHQHLNGEYALVAFVLPEFYSFATSLNSAQLTQQEQAVPAACIESIRQIAAHLNWPGHTTP